MDLSNEIYAYAIENALAHGKAMPSIVLSKLFQHGLKKEQIKDFMPQINKIIAEVNAYNSSRLAGDFEKYKKFIKENKIVEVKGLKDLPNVRKGKKLVFRLAPFPSGGLHIGNTKTYLLNAMYAEKYKGKTLLVIDDTIGSEEKKIAAEAYDLIPEAFTWLGVKYAKPILYKSKRLEIYYKYAEELIRKHKAYVCSCSQEKLHDNRVKGIECSCRQYEVKIQMSRWKQMFLPSTQPGEFVLRLKTNMRDPNPAFRDRVLFRISDRIHPLVGNKYKVWTLLEFSWAVDDHLLGVTHIIRGKELMMEGQVQDFIWDVFKWTKPTLVYVGLVRIEGIEGKLSKSKAQKEVLSGEYTGWDDPRTWSVQSLRRRGILAETLREFVEEIGLNQNDISIPLDAIYSINRKKIDLSSNRYSFVEDPVEIIIENAPKMKEVAVKVHPEKTQKRTLKVGNKLFISKNDFNSFKCKEVRLMGLYNIKLDYVSVFSSEENKQQTQKVNWVCSGKDLAKKVRIMMPNGLYIKGLGDEGIVKLKKGQTIQFERFGFCRFDNFDKKTKEYEFWFAHN